MAMRRIMSIFAVQCSDVMWMCEYLCISMTLNTGKSEALLYIYLSGWYRAGLRSWIYHSHCIGSSGFSQHPHHHCYIGSLWHNITIYILGILGNFYHLKDKLCDLCCLFLFLFLTCVLWDVRCELWVVICWVVEKGGVMSVTVLTWHHQRSSSPTE